MEERPGRPDVPPLNAPRINPTVRDFRPPEHPTRPGLRLVAGYEILAELGRGGMGVVFKARQVHLDRCVALKMILSANASREDLIRFRIEAEAVARLQHPNIVQVYEIGEHEGRPFFSLEYLEGGNLDHHLRGKPLDSLAAGRLVEILARAIHYAHERGVIHRDLKPANILLPFSRDPEESAGGNSAHSSGSRPNDLMPKITDFGLARRLDDRSRQTQSGVIVGTPCYMAPEQAEGKRDVGPLVDVYALGAILYECLTGRPPFSGGSVVATLQQVRLHDPVPPSRLWADVPRDLETICLKCLHKEPERRYPTALALADDLRRFLEGRPVHARPVGWTERTVKWVRRRPSAAALLAVTALLVGVLAAAVPLHILHLRSRVTRITAAMKQAEEESRLSALHVQCERALRAGRDALEQKDPESLTAAGQAFAQVQALASTYPSPDDELHRLREQARRLQARAKRELRLMNHTDRELSRARAFLDLRDEAFFHLYRDVVAGPDTASPRASERAARKALASFPDLDCLDKPLQPSIRLARQEVLFLLAEATSRLSDDRQHLRNALAILDGVRADGLRFQSIHRYRARYLDLLGEKDAAQSERAKAELLPPGGALDWFLLGLDRWRAKDVAKAMDSFDRALDEQPGMFWARFFHAVGSQKQNNHAEAKASLDACIRARPDFLWSYLLRGFLSGQQAKGPHADVALARAEADFNHAERLGPDAAARYVIHVNRGVLAMARKKYPLAVDEFQRAVLTLPGRYHGHVNLARAYWLRGQQERALATQDHALRLKPKLPSLHRTRAKLHRQRGDTGLALRDLERAIALESAGRASAELAGDHREHASILYALKRYPEALVSCREALRLRSGDPAALRLHAELLLELGKHREAVSAFGRYLAKGKPDVEVYRRRARARAESGDLAGVVDDYTCALAIRRDAPLLTARGWANLVTDSPHAARRDFEAALQLAPDSADALAGRALARLEVGEVKAGLADAEAALRQRPRSPRVLYNVARALARAGAKNDERRYQDRALVVLRQAILQMPAGERGRFWRDKVRRDSAFRPLSSRAGFTRLEQQFSTGRTTSSAQ
jgi:tetratricopeptide (TPR) repeat protein